MFNSIRHGRVRRRRSQDSDSGPSLKKPKYTIIRWKSHFNLDELDKQILYQMCQSIKLSSDLCCFDIAKNISEYALGWIKLCPQCKIGEILIIPSRLWHIFDSSSVLSAKFISPIICSNCYIQLYIHKCGTCSMSFPMRLFNGYSRNSWWLYHETSSDTKYVPLPESNTCKDCIKEIHPEMLTLYRSNIQCEELCGECIFECALCNNTFCKKKHLGYYCFVCQLYYCSMCQDYCTASVNNPCINCFRNLQKYALYYPNLQNRLIFDNYFGLLLNNNNNNNTDDELSMFIPLNVIHCVAEFLDGVIIDCACCAEGVGQILASGVYNYRKYIDQQFKCNFGHINYVHYCDHCQDKFIVNSISCLKYIAYETIAWSKSLTEDDIVIIRENICHTCYTVDDKVVVLCNDAECSSICNECSAILCKSRQHSILCILCDEEYCINHSDWLQHHCRICEHAVCPECQVYCDYDGDLQLIQCYDLYGLCCRDYSPYMNQFCNDPCDYIQCLDIFLSIKDSNTPFTFLEEWDIITEIALYAR